MTVEIIPSIKGCLEAVETKMSPINENNLSFGLEALIEKNQALTDHEKKGCRAEIFGLRFLTGDNDRQPPWGLYFVAMSSMIQKDGTEIYQPDANDIDLEIINYWKHRLEETPHPTLRARYADLTWEMSRLWNNNHSAEVAIYRPRVVAQQVIEAYLDAVRLAFDGLQAWRFLGRAVQLATYIKDDNLIHRAKELVFSYQREQMESGDVNIWQIDDLLWKNNKGLALSAQEHSELLGWLDTSLNVHSDIQDAEKFDPHQALSAAERIGRRLAKTDPAKCIADLKKAGAAFEAISAQANALTAISWLESLNEKYRTAKLNVDVIRVESMIRARSEEAQQEMKRLSQNIDVPEEEMIAWLDELTTGSADLALSRVAVNLLTSEETLSDMVKSAAANAPLQAHIKIVIMGRDGNTTATIGSVKDDMPGRIINQAAMLIGATAPFVHQALQKAKDRWTINADGLLSFLAQSPVFPAHTHSMLKNGIDAWFAEDTVKAIHVLVPQVEAALREILTAMGESVMQPSKDAGGLETIGMGAILSNKTFKEKFDPKARLHLRSLYTDPKGINLRNKVAHGIAGEELLGRGIANWVIHSLLVIRVYSTRY